MLNDFDVRWTSGASLGSAAGCHQDALETQAIADEIGAVAVVVDHYALDAEWEAILRRAGTPVVVIDDLADRQHDADLLIDTNPLPASRYDGWLRPETQVLAGPGFALLPPSSARITVPDRSTVEVRQVLVSLGGGKNRQAMAKVIAAFSDVRLSDLQADVVTGEDALAADLESYACSVLPPGAPSIRFHGWVEDLLPLMSRADVSIGAGGLSNWERLRVGLPTVVMAVAPNQVESSTALDQAGLVRYAGSIEGLSPQGIADALAALITDTDARAHIVREGPLLVDGRGAERCAQAIRAVVAHSSLS